MSLKVMLAWKDLRLPFRAEGQISLPKQPPFPDDVPGPAAIVEVELTPFDESIIKLFDYWFDQRGTLAAKVDDGRGVCIMAGMQCVAMRHERGLQITRPWSEPMRDASVSELPSDMQKLLRMKGVASVFYRPHPRWHPIVHPVFAYTLHAPLEYRRVAPLGDDEMVIVRDVPSTMSATARVQ